MTAGAAPSPTLALRFTELDHDPDLVDLVTRARDAGHSATLMERPGSQTLSAAGLGRTVDLVSDGTGARIEDPDGTVLEALEGRDPVSAAAALWERWSRRLQTPGGSIHHDTSGRVLALGGVAFRPDRTPGEPWVGFPSLLFRVPRLAVVRSRGRTWTVAVALLPGPGDPDRVDSALDAAEALLDLGGGAHRGPGPRALTLERVVPDGDWLEAVRAARLRISAGELTKVVLARQLVVHADGAINAGSVLHALRAAYPSCRTFLIPGSDGTALVGATPEVLVARSGAVAVSEPMAGSTARGETAAEDARLAAALLASTKDRHEHALVVDDIVATLRGAGAEVVFPAEPLVVSLANIQHLETPVRATFADRAPSALQLCAALHPTPAVGGHPRDAALRLIDELEGIDRGLYSGVVGWIDSAGDGELSVALRCGLLWEDGARLYAGVGIVADSDPEAEFAETELKLGAMLSALAGPSMVTKGG